ncbi:hypothetical protein [Sorangium sp. So ce1151]|uniref:hypothetical protein n=1 Tax=Sorangium sp. So ce1151 TaxID=3133332 RepID=UPI003F63DADA
MKVCADCACDFARCSLPQTVAANSRSSCEQIPEAMNTPFNPHPGWGGSCLSPGTVPSSQVGSIWIGSVTRGGCKPRVHDALPVPEGPSQVGLACHGSVVDNQCPSRFTSCMLNQQETHVPPGWRYCVVAQTAGIQDCHPPAPPGEPPLFSERFLFYRGDLSDVRNCEPCACVTTKPGRCEARVSAYADSACSDSALIGTEEMVLDGEDACLQFDPGPTLGSLSAEWELREYPSCTAVGGGPHPAVVCCLPEAEE